MICEFAQRQTVEITLKVKLQIDGTHSASEHVEDVVSNTSWLFSTAEVSLVEAEIHAPAQVSLCKNHAARG